MSDNIQIFCENTGAYLNVKGGETLLEIYERIQDKMGIKPICAHVNNKTEGLCYPVFMPKKVKFLDRRSPSGQRMYVRSLCMVLAKAVHDLFPAGRTLSGTLCLERLLLPAVAPAGSGGSRC